MLRSLVVLVAVLFGWGAGAIAHAEDSEPLLQSKEIVVHKSPWCGCCEGWIAHLEHAGAKVTIHNEEDLTPTKTRLSVPDHLQSCHTAVVDGYVIEGHVPIADIARLLKAKPKAKGISVPSMPAGSPGMEMGNRKDAYNVILFGSSGDDEVFASH